MSYLGNDRQRLLAMLAGGKLGPARPGQVIGVKVYHDNWCAIFRGGQCNCSPEIKPVYRRGYREN
jgi:hypothetical protein